MELLIMSLWDAAEHKPEKNTCALRIFSSYETFKKPLQNSPFYVNIFEYIFDDVEPWYAKENDVLFDTDMAKKLITDFDKNREKCESLLVHCGRGINRSPAVGMALNDIFKLGRDSSLLEKMYPECNWYIYNTMKEVAEKYFS